MQIYAFRNIVLGWPMTSSAHVQVLLRHKLLFGSQTESFKFLSLFPNVHVYVYLHILRPSHLKYGYSWAALRILGVALGWVKKRY